MTPELQRRLTWEEATERFLDVAELKAAERPGMLETAVDKLAWAAHNSLTGQTLLNPMAAQLLPCLPGLLIPLSLAGNCCCIPCQ